ncbi:GOLPH3/VPS74 family protein [Allosalinactinospora lopnorensis]|uniref:GOLPH3/VPS74 family protein n=1 Tax=Allosalinactinospora lopnorensis TaxID=1352348 RepID=UPI0006970036|nr:GPP34 family phosphoprotein [Allosalinactinospora lopnorensis]
MAVPQPTIAEELLLLCHDPTTGRPTANSTRLTCGLAGATVAELALSGRITIDDEYVHDARQPAAGDPHLDALAERIAAQRRPRKIKWWVQKTQSARLRGEMLQSATDRDLFDHERKRVLGLFPLNNYRPRHPEEREELRQRLHAVLVQERAPDDSRTVALLALCGAVQVDRKLFPGLSSRERRRLMKQTTEGDQISRAVASVIRSIEGATAAAAAGGGGGGDGGGGGG